MSTPTCPNCGAALGPTDLSDGWCDTCGKKLPSGLTVQRPPTTRRDMGLTDEPRLWRPDSDYWRPRGGASQELASLGARLAGAILDGVAGLIAVGPGYALVIVADQQKQEEL